MQTKELSITKKNFWDRNAARYDRFMRKNAIAYDQLYALLRPAVWHKTVLEVATGTGQVAKHLLCAADHIEATDVSAAMIAQAKRGNFSSKLYFSVQDMFHLPYADQSFDVVIVSNALHIVPHPEKALIEFRRVLKNDGTLIAPTFTHAENSPWGRLQALALKIAGFPLHSRWTSAAYLAFLQQNGWNGRFLHCAVRTACLPHATVPQIKQCTGLDAADIVQAVRAALTKGENEL